MNKNRFGLALGTFAALLNVLWAALVALGAAQALADSLISVHFLSVSYVVLPFDWGKAAALVSFSFIAGYLGGFVFAAFLNRFCAGKM